MADQAVLTRFHQRFYDDPNTWAKDKWYNIRTEQNPNDIWMIQEVISEVKPDCVIEAGTFYGGSALIWATILEQINPEGRVITIDIEDFTAEASRFPIWQRRVRFIHASSTVRRWWKRSLERLRGKKLLSS